MTPTERDAPVRQHLQTILASVGSKVAPARGHRCNLNDLREIPERVAKFGGNYERRRARMATRLKSVL